MNPFIVTLGTLSIVRGVALVVSDAQVETGLPPVFDVARLRTASGPSPCPSSSSARLAAATWLLLARTQWGRWIYAVGGNPEGARRVGLPGRPRPALRLRPLRAERRRGGLLVAGPDRRGLAAGRASCSSSTRSRR